MSSYGTYKLYDIMTENSPRKILLEIKKLSISVCFVKKSNILQSDDVKETNVDSSNQSQLYGFIAVLISCCSSGFAGVYFEKILKGNLV